MLEAGRVAQQPGGTSSESEDIDVEHGNRTLGAPAGIGKAVLGIMSDTAVSSTDRTQAPFDTRPRAKVEFADIRPGNRGAKSEGRQDVKAVTAGLG